MKIKRFYFIIIFKLFFNIIIYCSNNPFLDQYPIIIKKSNYVNDKINQVYKYFYDIKNNLIKETIENPDKFYDIYTIYTYDDKNKLIDYISYNTRDDSIFYKYKLIYDNFGYLKERIDYFSYDNEESHKEIFEYDNKGNKIKSTNYNSGNIDNYYLYFYKDALLIKIEGYNIFDNKLRYYEIYEYDNDGNLATNIIFNNLNEIQRKKIYKYNYDNGKIIINIYDKNNNLKSYELLEYRKK